METDFGASDCLRLPSQIADEESQGASLYPLGPTDMSVALLVGSPQAAYLLAMYVGHRASLPQSFFTKLSSSTRRTIEATEVLRSRPSRYW